jgi:prepilin-type N-terminal cleavage/methylation domain-containing protein
MRHVPDRGTHRGFTFLEILISLAIVTVGFATMMGLASEISTRNLEARELAAATLIAHNQMEALKLEGYPALNGTGGAGPLDALGESAPGGRYSVAWEVRKDVPTPGVKQIQVVVQWTSATSRPKQVTLQTVVSHVVP